MDIKRFIHFCFLAVFFDLALYFALGSLILFGIYYKYHSSNFALVMVIISAIFLWLIRINDRYMTLKLEGFANKVKQ
jgi:hypothetical protein